MEEENKGISLMDIFRSMGKRKITTLIVIFATLIVSFLGLFVYSNSTKTYQGSLKMGWENKSTSSYPDGTYFNYLDIVSKDNLEKVKATKDDYRNLDVDKVIKYGLISIDEVVEVNSTTKESTTYYTITIAPSVFKSLTVARNFAKDLIDSHSSYIYSLIYNIYIVNYLSTIKDDYEYNKVFELINNEFTKLYEQISNASNIISSSFVYDKDTNKTLQSLRFDLDVLKIDYDVNDLSSVYINKKFVRNLDTYKPYFNNELATIERKIAYDTSLLNKLKSQLEASSTVQSDEYMSQITSLSREIASLEERRDYINYCLNDSYSFDENESNTYKAKVNSYIDELNKLSNEVEKAVKVANNEKVVVVWSSANYLVSKKEISSLIVIAGSLALTLIVTFVYGFIVGEIDSNSKNKNEDK